MKKRFIYGFLIVALALAVMALTSVSAFNPGSVRPVSVTQTYIFWAVLSLIFILIVTLGFIIFREGIKLYVERQKQREGSHIKTKLVLGALLLSTVPVFFMFAFTFSLTNRNLMGWFRDPKSHEIDALTGVANSLEKEMHDEITAQTRLLAAQPEVHRLLAGSPLPPGFIEQFCRLYELRSAAIYVEPGHTLAASWGPFQIKPPPDSVAYNWNVWDGNKETGSLEVTALIPGDIASKRKEIASQAGEWRDMWDTWKSARVLYNWMLTLITVFVLFVAVWLALFLAKQISVPISALLGAAGEVRKGNLSARVEVSATDELGDLVRAFNRMIEELEGSGRELDRRRRFTEAILESIPTGVISIGPDGAIRRVNRALSNIFPADQIGAANRLEDLFSRDDAAELRYMMKRARRTGAASRQIEMSVNRRTLHLAVTVSAIEEKLTSGFVIVLEDTSELLRAQKSAAWHEVARRVAHEIKNPLTPIALSAERIARQLSRVELPPSTHRIVGECAATIARSVESVKTLVDEFSQFARFPSAQPSPCDMNELVLEALVVFPRTARRHCPAHQPRRGTPPGQSRPRAVPARRRQPGR